MTTESHLSPAIVERALEAGNGVLRLEPAWVARDFLSPGRRLGLPESQYDLGDRGGICERWLASTTKADNRVGVPNEGLSYLALDSKERVTLAEAVEVAGPAIMGEAYAKTHKKLDRLAKIFDYGDRLPYHLHQMRHHAALVGRNPKEEAYYFPEGVDMGPHPESFLGVHPFIAQEKKYEMLLPYLESWDSDLILKHSKAYLLVPGDGFHIPAGTLHAPGSALTIELQEDSDVLAMLQARVGNRKVSKELLFKDVRREDREKYGERIILEMVDWDTSGDPFFFENRHTPPLLIEQSRQPGGEESWIFYNTNRFSGKRLVVKPGARYMSLDKGVYNLLVWQGRGRYGGHDIQGGNPALDELLVCGEKATTGCSVENTGSEDLIVFKFFGPDINPDVPMLRKHRAV
jgi:hypothetical protein